MYDAHNELDSKVVNYLEHLDQTLFNLAKDASNATVTKLVGQHFNKEDFQITTEK